MSELTPLDFKSLRMPRALWEKWDAALRSGEYQQARGVLREERSNCGPEGGYCCLGVLQDVADKDVQRDGHGSPLGVPTMSWFKEHRIEVRTSEQDYYRSGPLPYIGYLHGGIETAIAANDVHRMPFVEIADLIKATVEFTEGGAP